MSFQYASSLFFSKEKARLKEVKMMKVTFFILITQISAVVMNLLVLIKHETLKSFELIQ